MFAHIAVIMIFTRKPSHTYSVMAISLNFSTQFACIEGNYKNIEVTVFYTVMYAEMKLPIK